MHKDRSGAVVRIALVAALLGAAAWGYMSFVDGAQQTAQAPEMDQGQMLAEGSGYETSPNTFPEIALGAPASEPTPPPSNATTEPDATPPAVRVPPAG
jgi:hypothetical protein